MSASRPGRATRPLTDPSAAQPVDAVGGRSKVSAKVDEPVAALGVEPSRPRPVARQSLQPRAPGVRAGHAFDDGGNTVPVGDVDYANGNRDRFVRRARLLDELAAVDEASVLGRRQLRRLQRELNDLEEDIVMFNMGLVRSYVRRFTTRGRQRGADDFEAAGVAGLVAAMKTYDPSRGPFAQWAFHPIQRAVTRAVRDLDHANLNPGDFERRPDILRARERLAAAGAEVTDVAIAEEAATTVTQVKRVLQAPRFVSTDDRVGDDGDMRVADVVPGTEDVEAQVIDALDLAALESHGLTVLDPRELLVLTRHYGLDGNPPEKLAAIGADLRLSREAARQIESKALSKLAHPLVLRRLIRNGS